MAPGAPFFETETGEAWTPIGHNDAISWPTLRGALTRPAEVASYFASLRAQGITCLRLMLEYVDRSNRHFERRPGVFNRTLVRAWDALFTLGERYGVRFLLTPFDTFWMWKRWRHHAYNSRNGGPCASPFTLLASPAAREVIKTRFAFVIDRWGGSGALFAWDLWNELHPAYAEDNPGHFDGFISEIGQFVRDRERSCYGRTHVRTVSAFGPILLEGFWSKELGPTMADPRVADAVYRHPLLDCATVHTYATGTIDAPKNTVDAAIDMGRLTRTAVERAGARPYFDSEHGPIHTFKDRRRTLPAAFDEEYFRHLQWAHVASGGAGGGMRWPNRHPHVLTAGMHAAQAGLARFLPLIDWLRFKRRNLNEEIAVSLPAFAPFGCGDDRQAVVWLLRRSRFDRMRQLSRAVPAQQVTCRVPGLSPGAYRVVLWETERGELLEEREGTVEGDRGLVLELSVARDLALAIRRV